jgi:hypothetical protein
MVTHASNSSRLADDINEDLQRTAPRPRTLAETGLSQTFLAELTAKHLLNAGVLNLSELSARLCLPTRIIESLLQFMRQEARVEVMAPEKPNGGLRYQLTDRGRNGALDASMRSGYTGPAPVPLQDYARVVRAQSVHDRGITKDDMQHAFDGIVVREHLLDELGPSLNSGRAIFVYGPAGTGKTFIAQKLARLFREQTLIPHAVAINETVISVFDPVAHQTILLDNQKDGGVMEAGHDARYVCCERPVVVAGGELTVDMLEVQYDASAREHRAPLQLKANNGLLMIDDMGRQRSDPATIFNRWIVPMEEKVDYLSLGAGRHFTVPFDVVLIFSTNLHPLELADEAFLRRIGYKIELSYLNKDQYRNIWQDVCREYGIVFDDQILEFVLTELHEKEQVGLLPCHPRDLLGMAVDLTTYLGEPRQLTKAQMRWAWKNYFVPLKRYEAQVSHT